MHRSDVHDMPTSGFAADSVRRCGSTGAAVRAVMPMSECPSGTLDDMWTHDGKLGYRLHTDQFSIVAYWYGPAIFDVMVDVEVTYSDERWSATFMTPEQIRECLTRWVRTGEALPGNYFYVPDGVIVADLNLNVFEAVVRTHIDNDGTMRPPFTRLEEDE